MIYHSVYHNLAQEKWRLHGGFNRVVEPQVVVDIVTVIVHVELLVGGVVVQAGKPVLEPLKEDAEVALLFGFGVVLVKDLLRVDVNCSDSVQNATHHEGVAHSWLIDAGLPFLHHPKRRLVYFSNDHAAAGFLRAEGHPQAGFICGKVEVLINGAGVGESGAGPRNHPGFILHGGEIELGQPERAVDLIVQGVVTDDEVVPCASPAAVQVVMLEVVSQNEVLVVSVEPDVDNGAASVPRVPVHGFSVRNRL